MRRESTKKGLSRPIVRIAMIGIALGMAVMITAVAIVIGFQTEIREKVIGFGSHIQITNFGSPQGLSYPKLRMDQPFYPGLDSLDRVRSIHVYALKEGVIETPENIQGVIAKGVAADYDWSFFDDKIKEGAIPEFGTDSAKGDVMISSFLAGRLQLTVGDQVPIYFQNARGGMSRRNFRLSAIYDTGLQDLDAQFVFIDLDQVREINQWGLDAALTAQGCINGRVYLKAHAFGGDGDHRIRWSADSLAGSGPHGFCILGDTTIYAVVTDRSETIPDTAFFHVSGIKDLSFCHCPDVDATSITTSGGSGRYYTGGFEVVLEDYKDLETMDLFIYEHLDHNLRTTNIKQTSPEIFNWLEMLDMNSWIIISLMIFISVINMSSALLILIMERTTMIGILKAMGATTALVQRIFLHQAAVIILVGLVVGNAVGLGFCFLQDHFGWLTLDPENYYVSEVPVLIRWDYLLVLNAGTFAVCLVMMILPALAVNRIHPAKAIRFN